MALVEGRQKPPARRPLARNGRVTANAGAAQWVATARSAGLESRIGSHYQVTPWRYPAASSVATGSTRSGRLLRTLLTALLTG